MKSLITITLIILLTLSFNISAQSSEIFSSKKLDFIDSLISKVSNTVNENWYLVKQEKGFDIYYCKSCTDQYYDSLKNQKGFNRLLMDRYDIFNEQGPDSVCYYSSVSYEYTDDISEIRNSYKNNGIMKISVKLEKTWSHKKIKHIKAHNDSIKNDIIQKPLGKSNKDIFSDYRFWLPNNQLLLKQSNKGNFIRLPYSSYWYDYSIFITPDKPSFFCSIMYIDKNDDYFFSNPKNNLEKERSVLLHSLANCMGINDFKIIR